MKPSSFGLDKDVCRQNGYKIFFGVDWLSEDEFICLDRFFIGRELFLSVANMPGGALKIGAFSDCIEAEGQFVTQDKLIVVPDYAMIYVSDDRDIFLVAATPDNLSRLVDDMENTTGPSFSALVETGSVQPSAAVRAFYDHWRDMNIEML